MSDDRADRIADRLRDELAAHADVTYFYGNFGCGYITGLKRALHLLTVKQEVDMSDDRADRIAAKSREEVAEMIEVCDPEDQFAHGYIIALQYAINLLEFNRND